MERKFQRVEVLRAIRSLETFSPKEGTYRGTFVMTKKYDRDSFAVLIRANFQS